MHSNYLLIDFFNKQLVDLKRNKINEYKQKSEMIIDAVLGISKTELYIRNHFIPNDQLKSLEQAFSMLLEDMPVQHIIGKTHFYEDSFFTPPGIFIPRPETELLIDCIQNDFESLSEKTVLDIGCGSGCIGITLASLYKNFDVTGIDISNKAINIATKNAKQLKVTNIDIIKQNIFDMKPKKFDIIVILSSNLAPLLYSQWARTTGKKIPWFSISETLSPIEFRSSVLPCSKYSKYRE